jgi:hypothetical protein
MFVYYAYLHLNLNLSLYFLGPYQAVFVKRAEVEIGATNIFWGPFILN